MFSYHIFIICCVYISDCIEFDQSLVGKFVEGENLYKELSSKVGTYGSCWSEALSNLGSGCKHLTEEVQGRLALDFTNCFLEHSGSKVCPCPQGTPIKQCLRDSSDRVFSVYTEFFTHTHSICHFLQNREWQDQTEKTVNLLSESAKTMNQKLDASSISQSRILDLQRVSLVEQKRLMSNSHNINSEIEKSRILAREAFEDFSTTTNEQRHLIFKVFDRIKGLQNFVLGEFTGVYTFAFYVATVALIYILTSVPRTADARFCLLLVITANAAFERVLSFCSLDEEMMKLVPLDAGGPMYSKIWLCRKVAFFTCFAVLLFFYYHYKDYNVINNRLLQEIQQQNNELKEFIQSMKFSEMVQSPYKVPKVESGSLTVCTTGTKSEDLELLKLTNAVYPKSLENTTNSKATPDSTPVKQKATRLKSQSNTPKKRILSSKENVQNELSPRRYNLRSTANSPVLSPYCLELAILPLNLRTDRSSGT